MRLRLADGSRVLVDLRATGVLRALAHSPTLVARPEPLVVAAGQGRFEAAIEARFRADELQPPGDMSPSDREKMRQNIAGSAVLDARRFPTIDFRGRYAGTTEAGTLSGELRVRGAPAPIDLPIRVSREGDAFAARGAWEGTLTALGVEPFRALFGAIRLKDWIALRLDARFVADEA